MRDFLKYTAATLTGLLLFVGLSAGGFVVLLLALITATAQDGSIAVKRDSILAFDLSQPITDTDPDSVPGQFVETILTSDATPEALSLRSAVQAIEEAATDDRIVGLYLYGTIESSGLSSGFASLREIRQALQTFRDSGKPIYAYDQTTWQERDYYLASTAESIVLHPSSLLELNGLNFETLFFAEALQKYGIGIQVLRVGKYKSAIEPFTRRDSSPEDEQQTRQLLTDLWNEFLTATATDRSLTPQALQQVVDQQPLLMPMAAQTAGLATEIAYEDQVFTQLREWTGETEPDDTSEDAFRQVSLADYAEAIDDGEPHSGDRIAVVYAEGNIVSGVSGLDSIGGDSLSELLRQLRQDDDIKAIVLRVNSPGGGATASEQIAREVQLTTEVKPVIVSMGNYAASGGYQISAYADQIFASPSTITGSIGVFGVLPNFQTIANNNGITWDNVKTGRYADIETVSRPKTPEELAIVQQVVDRIYDQFLTIVADGRELPAEKVAEIAQGRVWSGVEAQKLGLVDELGGLEEAIAAAATAADLGDDWQIEEYPRPESFWFGEVSSQQAVQWLTQWLQPAPAPSPFPDPLMAELRHLQVDLDMLRSLNDPVGAYSRLPFNPRID